VDGPESGHVAGDVPRVTGLTGRERISYSVRILLSHALYYTGILRLLQWVVFRRKAVVLVYHRVLTNEQRTRTASQPGLVVGDETFARHVALLKRLFTVLTLDEFERHLARREPFNGPSCLVTFDDGWIDNYENALPVLRAHGVPAAMFLPVNFIGQRRMFSREALTLLMVEAVKVSRADATRAAALRPHLASLQLEHVLEVAADDPLDAVIRIVGVHRYASGPEFEATLAKLAAELALSAADLSRVDGFIDWGQVESMGRQGFTFGGHGADHCVLTRVPADVIRCEVTTSKNVLDGRLAKPVSAFAYPNGAWNAEVASVVKAAGYSLAFTVDAGPVSCDDDPLSVRRINIHEGMTGNSPMFLARLVGVF